MVAINPDKVAAQVRFLVGVLQKETNMNRDREKEFAEMAERVREARRLQKIMHEDEAKYNESKKAFWDHVNSSGLGDNITLDDE